MSEPGVRKYAFNRTQQSFLATDVASADTHWTRLKGLLATKSLAPGKGLWIVPCHGVHTLAMRYPIDVVYLDEQNVVVHLVENLAPWRVTSVRMEAATVLELPAHTIWSTHTQVGDKIEIESVGAASHTNGTAASSQQSA
ncbi:MAG: DUF192 domain-containing protein [Terriglobales bacterium]